MGEMKSVEVVVMENKMVAGWSRQAQHKRPYLGQADVSRQVSSARLVKAKEQGARNPPSFLMNAVSRTITTLITTHPFVPNFAGEVDFSPIKLGPVTNFRAHSVSGRPCSVSERISVSIILHT